MVDRVCGGKLCHDRKGIRAMVWQLVLKSAHSALAEYPRCECDADDKNGRLCEGRWQLSVLV